MRTKKMNSLMKFYGGGACVLSIPLTKHLRVEVLKNEIVILDGNTDVTRNYFIMDNDKSTIKANGHNLWAVLDIMRSNIKRRV